MILTLKKAQERQPTQVVVNGFDHHLSFMVDDLQVPVSRDVGQIYGGPVPDLAAPVLNPPSDCNDKG